MSESRDNSTILGFQEGISFLKYLADSARYDDILKKLETAINEEQFKRLRRLLARQGLTEYAFLKRLVLKALEERIP